MVGGPQQVDLAEAALSDGLLYFVVNPAAIDGIELDGMTFRYGVELAVLTKIW